MYPLCRTLHPQRIAYSWTHGSGKFASQTDMIWSPTAMQDCIQQCEYYPSFFMDHQYLLVRSSFCDPLVTGPGVWKFNTSILQYPEYIELVNPFGPSGPLIRNIRTLSHSSTGGTGEILPPRDHSLLF